MMIGLIGIDHRQASVDERADFALSPAESSMLVGDWQACGLLSGAIVLSTCNRVEIYYEAEGTCHASVERRLIASLLNNLELSPRLAARVHSLRGNDCIRHLFRLASGLESMVVGETQILGQLKEAYRIASTYSLCTPVLSRLFHRAFEVAKRIRSEYVISASPLSAGSASVDRLLVDAPEALDAPILIVGAGLMAETIYERLRSLGARHIGVYNRTRERAERFAEHHPESKVYCEGSLPACIAEASAIFVATSAPSPIVLPEHLSVGASKHIFDLAVPRNVAEAVGLLPGIRLYSIDELGQMGLSLSDEMHSAINSLIDEHLELFVRWTEGAQLREVIATLQQTMTDLLEHELKRLPNTLITSERTLIEHYDEHLRTTITTALIASLREASDEGRRSRYLEVIDSLCQHIKRRL